MDGLKTAIGLMSGTSMDGIDVALLRTDGLTRVERGAFLGVHYDHGFRERLKHALEEAKALLARAERPGSLADVEDELTRRHAEAVQLFLERHGLAAKDIDAIGFHGQTVLHRPDQGVTVQLGNGQLLADLTGLPVVYDMRANDMAHGGQGAPLVPVYHAALAENLKMPERPVCFVNIGGISNLTYVGIGGEIRAYDSGPGNTLIDQWVEAHAGVPFDQGGMIASEGQIVGALAQKYLAHSFFTNDRRRSLDRNDFLPPSPDEATLADGARTLAYVAATSIIQSSTHLPQQPRLYVVCGGGRLNRVLMDDLVQLAKERDARVIPAEEADLDGDAMEAEAWAYLAVRSMKKLPLTFPGTTGVRQPVRGGLICHPQKRI